MADPKGLIHARLADRLAELERRGLRRNISQSAGVDFTSNDYLGLSRHPDVIASAASAAKNCGVGAPGARLLGGHRTIHEKVERYVAEWCHEEAALLLTSGWHANTALLGTIIHPQDVVLSDSLNHASIIDGLRLARSSTHAQLNIFRHADLEHLEDLLSKNASSSAARIIVTESIYSMDGDEAPLHSYLELAETYDAYLIVDEAHAVGLYGPEGQGCVAALKPSDRIIARTLTAGKSLGVGGAFIVGRKVLIDAVINLGRSFIFTTAIPPPTAGAIHRAIEIVRAEPDLRKIALLRADQLRRQLKQRSEEFEYTVLGSTAIVPVVLGSESRALNVAEHLRRQGFEVRAVRPPTVPQGTSRLRLVCHASHSEDNIRELKEAIFEALAQYPNESRTDVPGPRPQPIRAHVVLGTDTDVGKTVMSALLTRYLYRRGPARYLKPVQTGSDSDTQTVARLANLASDHVFHPIVSLEQPASVDQAASSENTEVKVSAVADAVRSTINKAPSARWIIEAAGGLLVPFNAKEDQSDLVQNLGFPAILVARSGLGTLNHTLLTLEALRKRKLIVSAVMLVGPYHEANLHSLKTHSPNMTWLPIPEFTPLCTETIDAWLDGPNARILEVIFP